MAKAARSPRSAKAKMLTIRVEPRVADALKGAAAARGRSLSAFVIDAAQAAASPRSSRGRRSRRRTRGVPPAFEALCKTASQGGAYGYDAAGREIVRHLRRSPARRALAAAAKAGDAEGVLAWFARHRPAALAFIPSQRRCQFAAGVIDAHR